MPTITPDEAREKFGELMHAGTRTYREFEDPDGGIWRPVYDGHEAAAGMAAAEAIRQVMVGALKPDEHLL